MFAVQMMVWWLLEVTMGRLFYLVWSQVQIAATVLTSTGNQFAQFSTSENEAVKCLAFSPFRKLLLAVARYSSDCLTVNSDDGSVTIWDTNSKSVYASFNNVHDAPGNKSASS